MAKKSFLAQLENLANDGITIRWDNDKGYYMVEVGNSVLRNEWHGDDLRDLIDKVYVGMYGVSER